MQLVRAVCNTGHTYFDVYKWASDEYDLLKFDMVIVISDVTKTYKSHADNDVVNAHVDVVVFAFNMFSNTKLFMQMLTHSYLDGYKDCSNWNMHMREAYQQCPISV
ncbi:hypothetical protein DPMN_015562 [Dreissena polymorpha]|uniref:Uncharacterized protein n=1 Tax=Dreissena polymorpha TaxID=45954 RepID=A0A9D4NBQ0_DREPO|nr:hypothetical protein DPMN_015562 [Dreissena polymorpha]